MKITLGDGAWTILAGAEWTDDDADIWSAASGIVSVEIFGTPTLTQQAVAVGIVSGEGFGTPTLTQQVTAVGIVSAEAFGTPALTQEITLDDGVWTTRPGAEWTDDDARIWSAVSGIPSAEGFGTPTLTQQITAVGIVSAEAFGTAGVLDWLPHHASSQRRHRSKHQPKPAESQALR